MAGLGLPAGRPFRAYDVLNHDASVSMDDNTLRIVDQVPHSVGLIKLVDQALSARAPEVTVRAPSTALAGHPLALDVKLASGAVPATSYHWNFGDGTKANGQHINHTYTHAGTYSVNPTVGGIEGLSAHKHLSITVTGYPTTEFELSKNRRYKGSSGN